MATAKKPAEVAVTEPAAPLFRDKVYTSRTLVLPDNSTAQVLRGQVAADRPELLAWLEQSTEHERIAE